MDSTGAKIMTTEALTLENLEDQVRSLTVAESPAEVFKTLLEGTRVAAPRASVFLVRQNELKGWGAIGYPPEAAGRQREYIGPVAEGWLGEVIQSEPPLHSTDATTLVPGFGQPVPSECFGVAVRLKGRPIALIVIERIEGELPWYPSIVGILVRVAQLKLDLDLVRRKLAATGAPRTAPRAPKPEPVPPRATVAEVSSVAPGAAPVETLATPTVEEEAPVPVDVSDTVRASVAEVAAAAPEPTEEIAPGESPQTEAARRYARLVATDIRLYNEESVVLGRREGDLAERLQESLTRGKETFQRRHGELGKDGLRILYDAYTEVLAGGQADLIPASILD
jgi:hypothetical protein